MTDSEATRPSLWSRISAVFSRHSVALVSLMVALSPMPYAPSACAAGT